MITRSPVARMLAMTVSATAIAATAVSAMAAPIDHPGYVDLSFVNKFAGNDVKVEVNISKTLLKLAGAVAAAEEPDIGPLIQKLEQITVRVIDIGDRDQAELHAWTEGVTNRLRSRGWEPVAAVKERGRESVQVLMLLSEDRISGVLITVTDGKEAVFVNVVGDIDMEDLARVGNALDVPGLKKLKTMGKDLRQPMREMQESLETMRDDLEQAPRRQPE